MLSASNGAPEASQRFMEHLWDDFLPRREVHLLGGPSGAGKTTWLMKWLGDWTAGKVIYGRRTTPTPYVYITGDRSHAGMMRTMKRLNVDPASFPLYLPPRTHKTIEAVLNGARTKHPNARLFVIEGLAMWVPNGKLHDYWVVADFLRGIGDYCTAHDIDVLGVVHSPKQKEKDRYASPRDRVMGSAAWSAYSETIFLMEPAEAEGEKSSRRKLFILPRQAKNEVRILDFMDDGQLHEVPKPVLNDEKLRVWFDTVPANEAGFYLFTFTEALKSGIPERSLARELENAVTKGLIVKTESGKYKIPKERG